MVTPSGEKNKTLNRNVPWQWTTYNGEIEAFCLGSRIQVMINLFGTRSVTVNLSEADRGLIQLHDRVYYKEFLDQNGRVVGKELDRCLPGKWTTYNGHIYDIELKGSPKQVKIDLGADSQNLRYVKVNISGAVGDIREGDKVYYDQKVNDKREVVGKEFRRNVR